MRKLLMGLFGVAVLAAAVKAAQVNPTSNVLGDTAKSASTLVYRNASGEVDAATLLANETIITAHIKSSSVITAHMYLDLPSVSVVCIKTNKTLGTCSSNIIVGTGACTCS